MPDADIAKFLGRTRVTFFAMMCEWFKPVKNVGSLHSFCGQVLVKPPLLFLL